MNPLLSVVIPVYNAEKYLIQNVESLIHQTYGNFEAVYVDDGSDDKSLDILMDYQDRDSRIKVFSKEHEGVGSARNFGVGKTCGDYLLFLDADDFYAADAFMKLVETVEKYEGVEVVIFNYVEYDNITKEISDERRDMSLFPQNRMFACRELAAVEHLFQCYCPNIWRQMYLASVVKEASVQCMNMMGEDVPYAFLLMVKCSRMAAIDECLYYYRRNNAESAVGRWLQTKRSAVFARLYLKRELEYIGEYDFYKKAFLEWTIVTGYRWCISVNDVSDFSFQFHVLSAFFEQCDGIKEYVDANYDDDVRWMFHELTELSEKEFLFKYRNLYRQYRRRYRNKVYVFDLLNKPVIEGKRLVLYGAGCVGKYYYTQLSSWGFCDIVAWVDSHYEKFAGGFLNISSPDMMQEIEYDFILIAVLEEAVALEVRQFLHQKWRIEENKMLWFKPVQ